MNIHALFCRSIQRGSNQLGASSSSSNHYQTPSLPSYFATLPPLSPSTTTSTTTSTAREGHDDEAEEYDYEENGSAFDSDLNADLNSYSGGGGNGSQQSGCQLTRSASEEALPVRAPFSLYVTILTYLLLSIKSQLLCLVLFCCLLHHPCKNLLTDVFLLCSRAYGVRTGSLCPFTYRNDFPSN